MDNLTIIAKEYVELINSNNELVKEMNYLTQQIKLDHIVLMEQINSLNKGGVI